MESLLILYDGGRADIGMGNTTTTRRWWRRQERQRLFDLSSTFSFCDRNPDAKHSQECIDSWCLVTSNVLKTLKPYQSKSQPLLSPLSMLFSRNDLWLQFDEGIEDCRTCHSLEEGDQRRTFGMIRYAPCFSCATLSKQHVEVSCPSQTTAQRFS